MAVDVGIDLDVDVRGIPEVKRALETLGTNIHDVRTLRKMLLPGVTPIRKKMRSLIKKSKRDHAYYYGGRKIAVIKRGHLKKSVANISTFKSGYRKYPTYWIGPVYTGEAGGGGVLGTTSKNVDAYYAHMMLGNKRAFERQISQKSYRESKSEAEQKILKKMDDIITKELKKQGF